MSVLLFVIFTLAFPAVSHAELKEGKTTQGEFALWLVQQAGALSKLPPAPLGKDAIDFLISLGIAPEEGWKKDAPIDKQFLVSLLGGDAKDYANLTFDELVAKVEDHLTSVLSDRHLAVFKATSGASGSISGG